MVLLPFPIQQDFGTWSRYGEEPTPPTLPTKRKRRTQMRRLPLFGATLTNLKSIFEVGDTLTLRGFGYSEYAVVEMEVTGVSIVHPKNDGRWCDERETTQQYTLRAKSKYGGFSLISREYDVVGMLIGYQKKNTRIAGNDTSVSTNTYTAQQTANPDAA